MLGSLILYLKGMRIMMFQLSGFYYIYPKPQLREVSLLASTSSPKPCRAQAFGVLGDFRIWGFRVWGLGLYGFKGFGVYMGLRAFMGFRILCFFRIHVGISYIL